MTTKPTRSLLCALGVGAVMLGLHACGASTPTQQLMEARRAYNEAQTSPAAKLTPDQVVAARQALLAAEKAHREEPRSANEVHLAYLAERKAQRATALGKIAEAKQVEGLAKGAYEAALEKGSTQDEAKLADERRAERERQVAEARAAAALRDLADIAEIKQDERGTVLTIPGSMLFTQGKSILSTSASDSLDKVAQVLEQQPSASGKIRIEGHTDARGSDAFNQQLSQERAEAVRDYLVQRGVDTEQLEAVGRGKADPIASNDTPEGRATNRRVEIVIPAPAVVTRAEPTGA